MIVDSVAAGRDLVRNFANLKDKDLKQIAYDEASRSVNDKKHKRISNALYYSIPIAAGIAAAANPASRVGRVGNFMLGAASWLVPFAVVDAVSAAKHSVDSHSQKAKKLNEEHPMLSLLGLVTVSLGAYYAITRGAGKFLMNNAEKIKNTLSPHVEKVAEKLNASKTLDKIGKLFSKVPSSVKDISRYVLDATPWVLLFAHLSHNVNHETVKTREYYKNLETLRERQDEVRNMLAQFDVESSDKA